MSRSLKALLSLIICVIILAVIAVGVWLVYTQSVPFTVTQGDTVYRSNALGVEIIESETFKVEHTDGKDAKIEAVLKPVSVESDYTFTVGTRVYSWNKDIVGQAVDLAKYVDVVVDQENNTVTVTGTTLKALESYLQATYEGAEYDIPVLPSMEMFNLSIKSGGNTMNLYCRLLSNSSGIEISQNQIYFE